MPRKAIADQKFTETEGATSDPPTTYKIQFDFSPGAKKRLEDLKELTEASTRAEVVRNALRLYEWLVTQVDPDAVIIVEDKAGNVEFRIPAKALRA